MYIIFHQSFLTSIL